jgi:hypothetical protein
MNRNNNDRLGAPQVPDELMRQIMSASSFQQNQSSYQVPTEIVDLPSQGKFYPEGHPLHNVDTLEIKVMTAKEEDILTSPTLVEKGIVFDKLIESLIVDKRIDASSLLTGDRNAILVQARISAYGPQHAFGAVCNNCSTVQKIEIDVSIKNKQLSLEEYEFEDGFLKLNLPKSKNVVHIKFLDGRDEREMTEEQRRRKKANLPEEQLILMYRKLIVRLNGDSDILEIANFAASMPVADARYIRKVYGELKPDLDLTCKFDCQKCGQTNDGGVVPINGDFFWPEL